MAYCTSRGDMEAWHVRFIPANEAGSQSRTPKSIVTLDRSELHADAAIERIGPAAPQRDGEADEAPEQRVLVTAVEPRKSSLPIKQRDDEHFHRRGGGEEAREQADDERDAADELDDQRRPDPGQRRIEPLLYEGADIGRGPARNLAPAMHQEIPAHRHAHDRPGERDGHVVKRLEAGKQQLGFVFRFGIDARHVFSSLNDQFHDHEGESITSADNEPLIQCAAKSGRTLAPQSGEREKTPWPLPHRNFAARWMAARTRT